MFTKEEIALAPKAYEAIKKISKGKWEWEPEKWQRVIHRGKVDLVLHVLTPIYVDLLSKRGVFIKDLTPLLDWQKVEEILEGMGYDVVVHRSELSGICGCTVHKNNKVFRLVDCKSRQAAVMQAMIELGKEE